MTLLPHWIRLAGWVGMSRHKTAMDRARKVSKPRKPRTPKAKPTARSQAVENAVLQNHKQQMMRSVVKACVTKA